MLAVTVAARAHAAAPSTDPPSPADAATDPGPAPDAATDPGPAAPPGHEVIEITGAAPTRAGVTTINAREARDTPGALGEPLRALSMLPGVTTSVAGSGYPIIRGTLPGESRFEFDGIEIPLLYHLLLGSQVIHPSFIADLTLRAGGAGAEEGHVLGGLITMTPAVVDRTRTELRANPIEVGVFHSQRLSPDTSIAIAARSGTLALFTKIYDPDSSLYYVDQQTRISHRLGARDELTLTSLAAYDYVTLPTGTDSETTQLGFHRLDLRWTHGVAGRRFRVGIQSELDILHSVLTYQIDPLYVDPDGVPYPAPHPRRRGSRAYGARGYADGELRVASALLLRAGAEAHAKILRNQEPLFELTRGLDPFLAQAQHVSSAGVWTSLDLRLGPLLIVPGIRADTYHADVQTVSVRQSAVDPRLAITADLPNGGQLELAGGQYTAPPTASVVEGSVVIGPLPTMEGTGALAGLSRGYQAQASIRSPLAANLEGSFAAYYRDTDYAIDFAMLEREFSGPPSCDGSSSQASAVVYRHVDVRAMGLEAMVRGQLSRSVTGWASYSLGKVDRDLGFIQLPHDYDQRHTLNVAAQWQRGKWRFGGSGHVHSGRPLIYPRLITCSMSDFPTVLTDSDPTRLRRPPPTWRVDLRAERAFQFAGWTMRLSFELQNASLTRETIDYDVVGDYGNVSSYHVVEKTLFIPLPLIGLEADL